MQNFKKVFQTMYVHNVKKSADNVYNVEKVAGQNKIDLNGV